jgi:hypothetical protein
MAGTVDQQNRPVATLLAVVALIGSMFLAVQCTPADLATPRSSPATTPNSSAIDTGETSPSDQAAATPSPSGTPQLADPVALVGLTGTAPASIAIDGGSAWVYSIETGDLGEVDLLAGTEKRSIHFGGFGSHVVRGADGGTLYVARFDTNGSPVGATDFLLTIGAKTGAIGGIHTTGLGALARAEDGAILALEKAGRLLRIDPSTRRVTGSAKVPVEDEHMEVVAAGGDAWVSSDHTPLRQISLPDMTTKASIDVGGGVPFVVRDGLIWGGRPGAIWALDPKTAKVVRTIEVPDMIEIFALDIDGGDAWLGTRITGGTGMLFRLDLTDGHVVGTHLVGLPAAVRIAGNRAWVASYLDNELDAFPR